MKKHVFLCHIFQAEGHNMSDPWKSNVSSQTHFRVPIFTQGKFPRKHQIQHGSSGSSMFSFWWESLDFLMFREIVRGFGWHFFFIDIG